MNAVNLTEIIVNDAQLVPSSTTGNTKKRQILKYVCMANIGLSLTLPSKRMHRFCFSCSLVALKSLTILFILVPILFNVKKVQA